MVAENLKHWDFLAPAWRAWEHFGMAPASLQNIEDLLIPPVLVIGAGQGLILDWLSKSGKECVGVDASREMRRYAKQRRGLEIPSGLAENLPFEKNQFGSVVLTTGVLNTYDINLITAIFTEANRVLLSKGFIIIGLFAPTQSSLELGHHLGYFSKGRQMQHRLFQIWSVAAERGEIEILDSDVFEQWKKLVSKWTRCSLVEAHQRVIKHHETFVAIFEDINKGANLLRQQNIAPFNQLKQAFNFELYNLFPLVEICLTRSGNQLVRITYEESIATMILVATESSLLY